MILFESDWITLLITSFAQAFSSSVLSLGIGGIAAFGLVRLNSRASVSRAAEMFFLLPQLLPSLFILMAAFNLYSYFGQVPSGFLDVVLIHSAINCGFCAVVISRLFSEKAGSYSELARVEGANLFTFLPALFRLLYRDLLFVFFTVFVFCFTSFSVPFVIGGYGSATVEVEIYRKIVAEGAIEQAMVLSLLQITFLMVMGVFLYGRGYALNEKTKRPFTYGTLFALSPVVILNMLLLFSSFSGVLSGWQMLMGQDILRTVAANATLGTFMTSSVAGLATLAILSLHAFHWPSRRSSSLLFSFTGPSPILFGFFLFLMGIHQVYGGNGYLLLGFMLAIFFLPLVFRFGLASELSKFQRQVEVARTLGASKATIFRRVIWPQLSRALFFFSGIVAFWAAGDFALSLFILPGEAHLPLLVRGLISRYRLDVATLLMWWVVGLGLIQLLIFQGIGYVVSRKSI